MVANPSWRELCRFDDLLLARAVATSIAAMEFDVRLHAGDRSRSDDHPGTPPFVVAVRSRHWTDLADVLDEIVNEQQEFDRALADRRRSATGQACLVTVVALSGTAELILLLASLDW